MITLSNVKKSYQTSGQSIQILSNVSFNVKQGEWVSILGPSGSGKTTLLDIISGKVSPDSGEILINNKEFQNIKKSNKQKFRREMIGFIFQDFKLLEQYTVLDNVMLPMLPYESRKKVMEKAIRLLESVGVLSRKDHLPHQLSGGEKQRTAIARALIFSPDILLCDEPTGNLDINTRDQILQLLVDLHKQEKTIVLVTHDEEAASKGNSIYQLQAGKLAKKEQTTIV